MSNEPVAEERKRMRPEDRRNALLDAALRVFADAGFRSASLTEIGDAAGVTKGCVYHYFESKEQLLLALMRERTQSAASLCLAQDAPASRDEGLAMMVKSLWRRYERDGQLELSTLALTELPHAPAVARVLFDEVVTQNRSHLRDVLDTTSADDVSRAGISSEPDSVAMEKPLRVNSELAAMLVPYMIMGAALGCRLYRGIDPVERTADEIEGALLQILTHGL